jgi:mannose-6-phosphate isomerase-like protein (cupin superfamily)
MWNTPTTAGFLKLLCGVGRRGPGSGHSHIPIEEGARRVVLIEARMKIHGQWFGGDMEVFSRSNSRNTGRLPVLDSWMLIGARNSSTRTISLQVSEIPVGSEQPVHSHEPEQCYYIIRGRGVAFIEGETREISAGDAIYIPPGNRHGIRNTGDEVLEYLTANSPAFSTDYEDRLWPAPPGQRKPEAVPEYESKKNS